MDKRYQVFISSTYIDLIEERQAVVEAVLETGHIPAGMELFKSGRSQMETIKKWIDNSDIYVLILGGRYGSIDKEKGKSYTQLEYEYALDKNMPVFAIIIDEETTNAKIPKLKPEDVIEIYNKNKYDDFKKIVLSKIVSFAKSLSEIKLEVHKNIHQFGRDYKLKGWIRGDQGTSPEVAYLLDQLTVKNKRLSEELRQYKMEKKIPKFDLDFNDKKTINLKLKDFEKETYPVPIHLNKIPKYLNEYINKDELVEYNDIIENSRGKIEAYLKELNYNRNIRQNISKLEVSIKNIGTLKANNIFIDIEFPTEVLIRADDKVKDLKIRLFENPLERAEKKRREALKSMSERLAESFRATNPIDFSDFVFNDNSPKTSCINFENNIVTIEVKSLIHTRKRILEDLPIPIVPLEKGEFLAKVNIFCEEMNQKEEFSIPIIVE